jgi:phosphate starvation-inducible protein PhoH and related proteins
VGTELGVRVEQRGNAIFVSPDGEGGDVPLARRVIAGLYRLLEDGQRLHPSDVRHAARLVKRAPNTDLAQWFSEAVLDRVDGRPITPRTQGQRSYVRLLGAHDVVFAVGPAGTGKTYLAMAAAVAALRRGDVQRIVLTRPAVEAGEKLGFLPGDLSDKVDPYLRPLYDALADMIPGDRVLRLFEKQVIEVAPLAFMRGRTLERAFVVLDEAQNTTREQMQMFLTRLGERSRMVITGDVTQIDLPPGCPSGMVHALSVLRDVEHIGVARFDASDVVRHPLVAEIIEAYDHDRASARERGAKHR